MDTRVAAAAKATDSTAPQVVPRDLAIIKMFLTQKLTGHLKESNIFPKVEYVINKPSNEIQNKELHWNEIQYKFVVEDD